MKEGLLELTQKITQANSVFYTAPSVYRQLKDQNSQSYLIQEGYDPKIHKFYDKIFQLKEWVNVPFNIKNHCFCI